MHDDRGEGAMTHKEKVAYLAAELKAAGMNPKMAAPPLFRLMWTLGWHVRPPHFQPFLNNALWRAGLLLLPWLYSFTA
jgi:hypothetical protein